MAFWAFVAAWKESTIKRIKKGFHIICAIRLPVNEDYSNSIFTTFITYFPLLKLNPKSDSLRLFTSSELTLLTLIVSISFDSEISPAGNNSWVRFYNFQIRTFASFRLFSAADVLSGRNKLIIIPLVMFIYFQGLLCIFLSLIRGNNDFSRNKIHFLYWSLFSLPVWR